MNPKATADPNQHPSRSLHPRSIEAAKNKKEIADPDKMKEFAHLETAPQTLRRVAMEPESLSLSLI